MKAIISHDIDHISASEHLRDLYLIKYLVRNSIEIANGKITIKEYFGRIRQLLQNKLHNIEELMEYDKSRDIPSTFFIGVEKGYGLAYHIEQAKKWGNKILDSGFNLGVHGLYNDVLQEIEAEFSRFGDLFSISEFGIRLHYLRTTENTVELLAKAGFSFNSSIYSTEHPYKHGELWEFPLHIMDGYEIYANKKWQQKSIEQAKLSTLKRLDELREAGSTYLTILFHDCYFSNYYRTWKEWYIWLIDHLIDCGFEFICFNKAIEELESTRI